MKYTIYFKIAGWLKLFWVYQKSAQKCYVRNVQKYENSENILIETMMEIVSEKKLCLPLSLRFSQADIN